VIGTPGVGVEAIAFGPRSPCVRGPYPPTSGDRSGRSGSEVEVHHRNARLTRGGRHTGFPKQFLEWLPTYGGRFLEPVRALPITVPYRASGVRGAPLLARGFTPSSHPIHTPETRNGGRLHTLHTIYDTSGRGIGEYAGALCPRVRVRAVPHRLIHGVATVYIKDCCRPYAVRRFVDRAHTGIEGLYCTVH